MLGENSPVRLGLILLVVLGCAGGFAGLVWWASKTTTQLEHIMQLQLSQIEDGKLIVARVVRLETEAEILKASGSPQAKLALDKIADIADRVKMLETKGSPALIPKIEAMEKEVAKLKEDLDVHRATTAK